jgi:hypothetical protein
MLLALIIMATVTLGIIFSGWLTPSPMRAQGTGGDNPPPNNENTNCGVATTNAWTGSCPSIVTNGSVSPTTIYQCGVTGPVIPTNIVVPVYSPINIFTQIITYSATNCTPDTNTENITYSVGGVKWDPPLPGKVTNTFSSTAYVNVTSSDTNNCASPGRVNLGTVTWSLPCPTITNITASAPPPNSYGADFTYPFHCAGGWYSWESVSWVTDTCGTPGPIDQNTNAFLYGGTSGDIIADGPWPPTTSCIEVTQQTIYFAPVRGGGTTNNNSTCSFSNTQTLQVIQTNSTTPAHGIIITSVTLGGGLSVTNYY